MEIPVTNNPYFYSFIFGFIGIIGGFLLSANYKGWETYALIVFGSLLFLYGNIKMKRSYDLDDKKKEKEIELMHQKIKNLETERVLGKSGYN